MKQVLALCSGGFDSITMIHWLRSLELDPVCLFFDYGQRNMLLEKACAERVCGESLLSLTIPQITWTTSSLMSEDLKEDANQYIEMRNLIFLSYAVSVAESKGITEIYFAIIDAAVVYYDSSPEFVENMNKLLRPKGISVKAPFIDLSKEEVAYYAHSFHVVPGDYFSCNTPKNGLSCGKCLDCISMVGIESNILSKEFYPCPWKDDTPPAVHSIGLKTQNKAKKIFKALVQ